MPTEPIPAGWTTFHVGVRVDELSWMERMWTCVAALD